MDVHSLQAARDVTSSGTQLRVSWWRQLKWQPGVRGELEVNAFSSSILHKRIEALKHRGEIIIGEKNVRRFSFHRVIYWFIDWFPLLVCVLKANPAVTRGHRLASTGWWSLCMACRAKGVNWGGNCVCCTRSWKWRRGIDTLAYRPSSSRYLRSNVKEWKPWRCMDIILTGRFLVKYIIHPDSLHWVVWWGPFKQVSSTFHFPMHVLGPTVWWSANVCILPIIYVMISHLMLPYVINVKYVVQGNTMAMK